MSKDLGDIGTLFVQENVPFVTSDEEALAVSGCLVDELRSAFEGDTVASDDTLVSVLDWVHFNFVYFKSNLNIPFLYEINLPKLIKLFINLGILIIVYRLQTPQYIDHKISILSIFPGVKFLSIDFQ